LDGSDDGNQGVARTRDRVNTLTARTAVRHAGSAEVWITVA
jgi:hypothetical protein